MVDPTSDLEEDVSEEDAPDCAICGEPIVESTDHSVRTWVEDDEVHHRHFCSDDCEQEWAASN